jgi:hypothetical protein
MAVRLATWLAILIGGTGGTLAALAGSGGAPAAAPARSPSPPAREVESATHAATPRALVAATSAAPIPAASSSAAPVSSGPAKDSASTAATPSVPASAIQPAAELLPLPTTEKALLRAEMQCDQKRAVSCIVAARSYETGSAGPTDPEKALKYRRIALTVWISQCDHNSAQACATLSIMYRVGSGVPESSRNADALLARARELCRFNDAPVCHELPSR